MSALVFELGVDDDLRDEVAGANARGEPISTVHVLRAMLRRADTGEAVAATGLAGERLMAAADQAIAGGTADEADAIRAAMTRAYAWAFSAGERPVRAVDVLIALADQDGCAAAAVLAAHGVTPLALKLHVSHRPPPADARAVLRGLARRLRAWRRPAVDPAAPVDVLMHDDAFTPQAFVVDVLERHLGATRDEATARMLEVHRGGVARIAVLPHAEAVQRIDEVTRAARAEGFPLRLSIDGEPGLPRAELRRR